MNLKDGGLRRKRRKTTVRGYIINILHLFAIVRVIK